jgi:hypothetical protein
MSAAVVNYTSYQAGPHSWALGRFIVSIPRLEELRTAALPGTSEQSPTLSIPLSVLSGHDVSLDAEMLRAFTQRKDNQHLRVEAVEAKAQSENEIDIIARAFDGVPEVYVEIPVGNDLSALVQAIGRLGMRAKVRTGGVTPEMFPAAEQLAAFLFACATFNVPFKATAGLHHPIRAQYRLTYAPDSPIGTMFGFLNLLLATAAVRTGTDVQTAISILEENDSTALTFTDSSAAWREMSFSLSHLQRIRTEFVLSFGSCSFEEPIHDLQTIGFL